MNAARKRWMLAAGLVLTLAAAGWVASQDEPNIKPSVTQRNPAEARRSERKSPPTAKPEPLAELQLEQLKRPEFSDQAGELFPSQNWQPPPPPPAAAARPEPPEPPRAPPLPYTYFGRMTEAGRIVVFLSRGNRDYAAKQGETLEGTYRIDEIGKDALLMTYLPLLQQQALVLGPAK